MPRPSGSTDPAPDPRLAERLVDLETKFTFLEDTLDALNDAVLAQDRRFEALERRAAALERRLVRAEPGAPPSEADAEGGSEGPA